MGNVAFYPNQRLSVNGTELVLVQSANVDFSVTRQEVFEFGTPYAVDFVQTDGATINLNFEYALTTGSNATVNRNAIGLDDIGTLIADVNGKDYVVTGAGTLTVSDGIVTSYSMNASLGAVPTVSVGVSALNAQYTANGTAAATRAATTPVFAVTPQEITIVRGAEELSARNVTLSLDMPRQYVYKLGSITPIATIANGAPKVTVETEVILGHAPNDIDLDQAGPVDLKIKVGASDTFVAKNLSLSSFNTRASINEVYVATMTYEGVVTSSSDLTIGG